MVMLIAKISLMNRNVMLAVLVLYTAVKGDVWVKSMYVTESSIVLMVKTNAIVVCVTFLAYFYDSRAEYYKSFFSTTQ